MTYSLDPEVFDPGTRFNLEKLRNRLREIAMLNRGLTVQFLHEGAGDSQTYCFENGIDAGVTKLTEGSGSLLPGRPFFCCGAHTGVYVEVAMQYAGMQEAQIVGYANCTLSDRGGTHLTGFCDALTRRTNHFARMNALLPLRSGGMKGTRLRSGLTAIVNVRLPRAAFDSATGYHLANREARTAVFRVFGDAFSEYLAEHPEVGKEIIRRALDGEKSQKS